MICAATLLASLPAGAEEGEPQQEVDRSRARDLAYGVTLYHYYQQQYLGALTELTAAQQLQRLPNHAEDAELLRGGISLSYGLDREARSVFEQLLAEPREGVDRDRAWFYLGKLSWRRGDLAASAEALAQMAPGYRGAVADEGHYLRAAQALQNSEEAAAAQQLQHLAQPCPFKPYYFYNLGVQRAAQQRWDEAGQAYEQLAKLGCGDSEGKNLRDRANVAAGFSHLAAGDTVAARNAFQRVRLQGAESDRALLGYGWSYANGGNYEAALSPWLTLAQRDLASASARESQLAIPYAYEQLGETAHALQQYRRAAERFASQRAELQAVAQQVQQGDLLTLFGLESLAELAWLGGEDPLPQAQQGAWLGELLATDPVQLALREFRDLHQLNRELLRARERLAVLAQVEREQRRVWQETAEGGRAEVLASRRQLLAQKTASLRRQLDDALAREDARALATPEQLARWQRLERAQSLAGTLGREEQLQQLRLMRGLLQWQDSEDFADRRWQMQRELRELEALAAQSGEAEQALQLALQLRQRPGYEGRIEDMFARVEQRQQSVSGALSLADSQLRRSALDALENQRKLLARGEASALVAMARLYDEASPEVPR